MKSQRVHLNDLLKRIAMIRAFTIDGRDAFMQSEMVQESVIRCFEVIGEIVKRLDPALTAAHPSLPWRQLAGFRDFLIHNYDKINLDIVWQSVEDDLDALQRAAEAMLTSLPEDEN